MDVVKAFVNTATTQCLPLWIISVSPFSKLAPQCIYHLTPINHAVLCIAHVLLSSWPQHMGHCSMEGETMYRRKLYNLKWS